MPKAKKKQTGGKNKSQAPQPQPTPPLSPPLAASKETDVAPPEPTNIDPSLPSPVSKPASEKVSPSAGPAASAAADADINPIALDQDDSKNNPPAKDEELDPTSAFPDKEKSKAPKKKV